MARFDRFTKALAVTTFPRAIKVLFEDPSFSCGGHLCHVHSTCPMGCRCTSIVGAIFVCLQI